jgi:hypothetical protein
MKHVSTGSKAVSRRNLPNNCCLQSSWLLWRQIACITVGLSDGAILSGAFSFGASSPECLLRFLQCVWRCQIAFLVHTFRCEESWTALRHEDNMHAFSSRRPRGLIMQMADEYFSYMFPPVFKSCDLKDDKAVCQTSSVKQFRRLRPNYT